MTEDRYDLPEGWAWAKFETICHINPRHPKDIVPVDTEVSFIPMSSIDAERGEIVDRRIKPFGKVRKGYTHFAEDDVLFAKITPCMENGKAAIAKNLHGRIGCGTTELHVLRPIGGVLSELIYYYIRQENFRKRAEANMSGTSGHLRVPIDFIKEADFPLPPTNEQKRIVVKIKNLLNRLNKTKQELAKIQPLLKKFRQSVLVKAFSGKLTIEWREKQKDLEPASVLLDRIREKRKKKLGKKYKSPETIETSDLPQLPEGWEWARMGECCLVNPRHPSDIFSLNTPVSFIPMPAINAEIGAITKLETRPLRKVIKGFTYFIEDDVLFAKITPCMENGKAAIAKNLVNGVGCGTTELHVLRPLGGISSEYIYHYIRQQSFRDRAEANMTGTAGQLRVPVDFMKNELLPMPPIKEQKEIIKKIYNFLNQADVIEKSVKIAQAHCEKLSQSILAKAFRGELVEQASSDESADELLKRIDKKCKKM